MEAGRCLVGAAFRDRINLSRREDQSRPVGEDGHPSLAFGHLRRERERLSCKKDRKSFPHVGTTLSLLLVTMHSIGG